LNTNVKELVKYAMEKEAKMLKNAQAAMAKKLLLK